MEKQKQFMDRVEGSYDGFVARCIDSFIPASLGLESSRVPRRARMLVIFSCAVVMLSSIAGLGYYLAGFHRMA